MIKIIMESFKNLLHVAEILLSPEGCPWDQKQTLFTLQPYLLEETHELIDAIDQQDSAKMAEELGDVFYALVFIAKLGEKNKQFTLTEALKAVAEKLIRRHPHVFAKLKVDSIEQIAENWEAIKKQEGRNKIFEGIPPTLPALARAQKIVSKLIRIKKLEAVHSVIESENELAEKLWSLIREGEAKGYDVESVLRRFCRSQEDKAGDGSVA